eukprot:m.10522 g.10522  ORF g.10522 m.10522 type:complete len:632 (-) comp3809_c0_seq1:25-1920(-)
MAAATGMTFASGAAPLSIRQRQLSALKRMLGFDPTEPNQEPVWKVLVYDLIGQDIISPLLSVADLRELGVTLHLLVGAKRDPLPDVPAVYFVMPTESNVARICSDIRESTYESFELNFISAVPRPLLEQLAQTSVESDNTSVVKRVFDMYTNFLSLEDDFFCIRERERQSISYFALHNQETTEDDAIASATNIVDSLFSVCVQLGVVPIIRCSRRNAAEDIAKRLDQKLRDNLRNSRSSLFSEQAPTYGSFQRPVLVILDRNIDMPTILHHTWTYQALIHDVLGMSLNRVTIKSTSPDKRDKDYDLSQADEFWQANRGKPFPQVATAIDEDLQEYRSKQEEVTRLQGFQNVDDDDVLADNTAKLTSAISSVPEMLKKKKFLDMHTTLLTTVVDHLKERQLDSYYEMEEEIMNGKKLSRPLIELLSDPAAGTPEDRMRLMVIYYMSSESPPQEDVARYEAILRQHGCNLDAMAFLKGVKHLQKLSHQQPVSAQHTSGSLFSHASVVQSTLGEFLRQGVKNLMPTTGDLPVTRIVDALMECKTTELTQDYLYFDPKLLRGSGTTSVPKSRGPFDEAVVFMVGGGNYTEYQNLVDYCGRTPSKKVVYGVSELMDASGFLEQLTRLGASMGSSSA